MIIDRLPFLSNCSKYNLTCKVKSNTKTIGLKTPDCGKIMRNRGAEILKCRTMERRTYCKYLLCA